MSAHTLMALGNANDPVQSPNRAKKAVGTLMLNDTNEHTAPTSPRKTHGIT
jgi:hypothetical protein